MLVFLRRRGLGLTSCREMVRNINEMGGEARVVRNDNLDSIGEDDVVVRWGCTSTIPRRGVTVINSAESIHNCNDKLRARVLMQDAGVPVPKTFPYDPDWYEGNEFLEMTKDELAVRYVARPAHHSQGRNLFVGNFNDCQATCINWGSGYISEYIPKVREVRVFVAQGRVVWVAEKTPADPTAHAWNVAQGGRFDNVRWSDWPISACVAAIFAARALGVNFAGIDVMLDAEGRSYVLEANSAPSQTSPYRQLCSAKAFKWMYENGKDKLAYHVGTWRELIHPALRSN